MDGFIFSRGGKSSRGSMGYGVVVAEVVFFMVGVVITKVAVARQWMFWWRHNE